jgi:Zn-dependent metalloprotease
MGAITATVHFKVRYNNAFWDGKQLVFGDGDGVLFKSGGFTSLSIVAAQMTKPVIDVTAHFRYRGQSGSLSIHYSDVFAALAEQWHKKQTADKASWLVGEGILGPGVKGGAPLRSMKAPGTAYDLDLPGKDPQPDHMDRFVVLPETAEADWGGVHINSGIPNRAFYEVARTLGGNAWEKAGQIWYHSLLRLPPNSTFADCARTTYQAAGELYGRGSAEEKAVITGWGKVGIVVGKGDKLRPKG